MAKKKKTNKNRPTGKNTPKKVVVNVPVEEKKEKLAPTISKTQTRQSTAAVSVERNTEMLFSKANFIRLGIGAALVIIGLLLMTGGHQAPNEWNADEVYSFRRVTLAPMVMLAGLIVTLTSIFIQKK